MKISHLRNILAIADQGSMRAAARKLDLAQPALSRSIQELEHELGAQLFERRVRGMVLTTVGVAFVERAKSIMTEIRKTREEAEQLSGGTGGTVTVAFSIVAHMAIAPRIFRPFRNRYPNAQLRIIEGLYTTVESRIKDGEIDFYVGAATEGKLAPDLVSEKLFDAERQIFCRRGHPRAGAKSIKELADADWMTTSITHNAETELADLFTRHRLPLPRHIVRTQSALTFMITLAHSDCVAMLPVQWASFAFTAEQFVVIDIKDLPPAPPVVVIQRSGLPLTPAAEYLLDLVQLHGRTSPVAQKTRKPTSTKAKSEAALRRP